MAVFEVVRDENSPGDSDKWRVFRAGTNGLVWDGKRFSWIASHDVALQCVLDMAEEGDLVYDDGKPIDITEYKKGPRP